MIRLVHALDAARLAGPGAVPTLEPAVRDYVAACKAQAMSPDAVLRALDGLVRLSDCHRGPGGAAGMLGEPVARWGIEAYHRAA